MPRISFDISDLTSDDLQRYHKKLNMSKKAVWLAGLKILGLIVDDECDIVTPDGTHVLLVGISQNANKNRQTRPESTPPSDS